MPSRPIRRPPSRHQAFFALAVALATALVLLGVRDYPWSLASMMGLAFGALAYTGWGTIARLRGIYGRSVSPSTAQGKTISDRRSKK